MDFSGRAIEGKRFLGARRAAGDWSRDRRVARRRILQNGEDGKDESQGQG